LLDPKRLFGGLEFEENHQVTASADWVLDCFLPGPPPVAVELLARRGRGVFFEKVVKLQDVRRSMDCRTVIVAGYAPSPEQIRVCTAAGISVALGCDPEGISKALRGAPCEEVNGRSALRILNRRNRARSARCRGELLSAFGGEWMTLDEAKSRLRWSFSEDEVAAQVRSLLASGEVALLARTKGGDGVYGLMGRAYAPRADLSDRCRKGASRRAVLEALAGRPGLTSAEVAEACGMSAEQARVSLRDLARISKVAKDGAVWRLR
jgi:hypothetical protein